MASGGCCFSGGAVWLYVLAGWDTPAGRVAVGCLVASAYAVGAFGYKALTGAIFCSSKVAGLG